MKTTRDNLLRTVTFDSLIGLGLNPFIIERFFYFVEKADKDIETLCQSIDGGIKGWGYISRSDTAGKTGKWHSISDIEGRHGITSVHPYYLFIPASLTDIDIDMYKAQKGIVVSPNDGTLERELFESFRDYHFSTNIMGVDRSTEKMMNCVRYWRGVLDTRTIRLKLDGLPSRTEDLRQADSFLKVFERLGKKNQKRSSNARI